jgi:hypothetical protein
MLGDQPPPTAVIGARRVARPMKMLSVNAPNAVATTAHGAAIYQLRAGKPAIVRRRTNSTLDTMAVKT